MNCTNHPAVADGVTHCVRCSNPFCADCLVRFEGRPFCAACKAEQLADIRSGVNRSRDQLAGIGRRFAGIFIDNWLIAIPVLIFFPASVGFPALMALFKRPSWQSLITIGFLMAPIVYEGSMLQWRGQTIGKIALGLRVVQAGGQRLSAGQSWTRAVVRGAFASFLSIVDYGAAFFTKEKTCVHDMAARSRVVIIDFVLNACPRCQKPIDLTAIPTSAAAVCPLCARTFEAVHFDPPPPDTTLPQSVDASLAAAQPCAFHEHNAAVVECERCGSFMCRLCRIDIDGRTLCPGCFERLATEGSIDSAVTTFRDYSGMAGVAALLGIVISFLGVLFGPATIYYAIMGIRQKKKMRESDGRGLLWFAMVVGAFEVAISLAMLATLFVATRRAF